MIGSILAAMANGAMAGAVLTATVWLALRLTPRARLNAATRYAFWWATLAATLALPVLYLRTPSPDGPTPITAAAAAAPAPLIEIPLDVKVQPSGAPVKPGLRPGPLGIRPEWIALAWLAISSLLLLRLAVSWILLDRRRERGSLYLRAEKWLARCRETRPGVRVAISDEIAIPIAVGPRHPSILIPARLADELADEELGQIVLHEAAHLARRDDYALLAQRVIEALFAFHPVVRWITRQMDLEREVACDDFVVAATGQPRSYASCLTRMVELCGGVRTSLAGAMAADDRSHLARRVERLLDKTRHTGTRLLKTRLAAMVVVLAAAAWMAGRAPALVAFAMPPAPIPQVSAPPAPAAAPSDAVEPPAADPPSPATPPAPEAPPQVKPERVLVPVEVMDPKNRFVTGLDRANFRLFEDGVEQQIEELSTADTPLSVGIVVDASGSMRNKQESVQAALLEFLKNSRPTDEFFVVNFNEDATLTVPFTTDTHAVENSMRDLKPRGGTALRDAVHMALDQMKLAKNPRKAILIVSDGVDNSSGRSAATLHQELAAADLLVYSINLADDPAAPRAVAALGQSITIGADNLVELRNTADGIAAGLRNRYVLAYTPGNPAHDGKYHELQVQVVAPPGIPPLKARARSGYYAPRQ